MTAGESHPDGISLRLRGSGAISDASDAARAFGEEQWLAEDELARLCVILEELLANLYEHGGVGVDEDVELGLTSEPGGVRISLVDPGRPFDPRQAPRPSERPERGGGAGIDIVGAWAQFVDYQVTDNGNRLVLLLPVGTSG